jgi:hypothetical protein
MTFALKLTHDEPRLVYLALVYHLGRPGSELDPVTKLPGEHGLREVKVALGNRLDDESAIVELDGEQYRRLLSAIYGCVNELRVYHMRGGGETTIPLQRDGAVAVRLSPRRRRRSGRRGDDDVAPAAGARGAAGRQASAQSAPGERRRRWPFATERRVKRYITLYRCGAAAW